MNTDCPNCSTLLEGDIAPGDHAACPFCGVTFRVCSTPFEQLRSYLETGFPPVEYGPFHDYSYTPRKNFTGWIINRIRTNDFSAVVDLMHQFHPDRTRAEQLVNTVWDFDFSPYFTAGPETVEEIRALWIRARLNSLRRKEYLNVEYLLRTAIWTRRLELTPDWIRRVLPLIRQETEDDIWEENPVTEEDLRITAEMGNNPLYDWAVYAPVAVRERLKHALSYSRRKIGYRFVLDYSADCRLGADFGYATEYLLGSHIFDDPDAKNKIAIHPTLEKYLDDLYVRLFLSTYNLYTALSMIPVPVPE